MEHLTYAEIARTRADLSTADAVALVMAADRAATRLTVTGAVPAAEQILLTSTGDVSFAVDVDKAGDAARVRQLALLLRRLLGFDQVGEEYRAPAPGALLVLIARAAREIDLPAPSYQAFHQTLSRFGAGDATPLESLYWRSVHRPLDSQPPERESAVVIPLPGRLPDTSPPVRERRVRGPHAADLRRELREADLQLFRALHRAGRLQLRGLIGGAAAASLLVGALSISLWPGSSSPEQHLVAAPELEMPYATAPTADAEGTPETSERRAQPRRSSDTPAIGPAPSGVSGARLPTSRMPAVSAGPLLSSALVGGDVFSPSFAADGREVFFHTRREGAALMRASFDDGPQPSVATVLDDGATNYHPVLSPDGAWLAFDSDRDGTRGVYVARPDGTDRRRVSGAGYAAVPRWSFDGRQLAFIKAEEARPRVWNVWVADLGTQTVTRVSRHLVGQAWGGSWFPDGEHIAYSVEDRLVIAALHTGTARVLRSPQPGRLIRTPAVSPDGKWIVFQVHRDGIWVVDVRSGEMRRLLADPTAEEFAWSPEGRRVVFHTRRSGSWSLWQVEWDPPSAG